jgi:hypothetical protein
MESSRILTEPVASTTIQMLVPDWLSIQCGPTDIKAIGVLLLELSKLLIGVGSRKLDVLVSSLEALGQFHLQTTGRSNGDLAATVLSKELSKHL